MTSLMHGVGDGEDELLQQSLREESALYKLGLMAAGGAAMAGAAVLVSSLAGQDPWGGASLSWHTAGAALAGAALGAPLAALRHQTWSRDAADALPALGDMHRLMAEEAEPWLCSFSHPQLAAHAALEVLPTTLLLLPAAQGGISAGLGYAASILQGAFVASPAAAAAAAGGPATAAALDAAPGALGAAAAAGLPSGAGALAALLLTAAAAGAAQSTNLVTAEEEVDILRDAVHSADRYYRLTAMEVGSTAADADRASTAFKAVAVSWMEMREDASSLAGSVAFLDVISISAIWYMTGDLAAAATAALAVAGVDYYHLHRLATQRGGARRGLRAAAKSPGGESG
ncbi:MAG: hypothetical protein J3K34DRAFT_524892 [Monoraphidium minutum]|nr:MAG: hypothetical protein J3K34DRAFT_526086 [Monoraphidium minutum]KAI8466049.1 MAG: hypothetical protein J3K34DRAFT_524892 [Monoraphidium minutum]